jgi:hypothetical protein
VIGLETNPYRDVKLPGPNTRGKERQKESIYIQADRKETSVSTDENER